MNRIKKTAIALAISSIVCEGGEVYAENNGIYASEGSAVSVSIDTISQIDEPSEKNEPKSISAVGAANGTIIDSVENSDITIKAETNEYGDQYTNVIGIYTAPIENAQNKVSFTGNNNITISAKNATKGTAWGIQGNNNNKKNSQYDISLNAKKDIQIISEAFPADNSKSYGVRSYGISANTGVNENGSKIDLIANGNISVSATETNNKTGGTGIFATGSSNGTTNVTLHANNITVHGGEEGLSANSHGAKNVAINLTAKNENRITSNNIAILSGDLYGSGAQITVKGKSNIVESENTGLYSLGKNDDKSNPRSQIKLEALDGNNIIRANKFGAYTIGTSNIDIVTEKGNNTVESTYAVIANQGGAVTINANNGLNQISGTEYAIFSSENATATLTSKDAKITASNGVAIYAATNSQAEVVTTGKTDITGTNFALLSKTAGNIIIDASKGQDGTINGAIAASGNEARSALIGNTLTVNSDLYAQNDGIVDITLNEASTLTGFANNLSESSVISDDTIRSGLGDYEKAGNIHLQLARNSTWHVTGDSWINALTANNSTLNIAHTDGNANNQYHRVKADTFDGTNNTINLRINMAEEKISDIAAERQTDQLQIGKNLQTSINNVNVILEKDTDDVTKKHSNNWLIKLDKASSAPLTMKGKTIAADGSTNSWQMKFISEDKNPDTLDNQQINTLEDTAIDTAGSWYLVRSEEENNETKTVEDFASAYNAYYTWIADLSDLRQRLGEVRSGAQEGLWAKAIYSKYNANSIGHGGFNAEDYSIHIGLDHIIAKNNERTWLLGASLKGGHTDMGSNHGSSADMNHYTAKVYGTYIGNNGTYADFVGSLGYYNIDFDGRSNTGLRKARGDYNTWGAGLSAEIGKKIHFAEQKEENGTYSTWFVEPQAQLSYLYVKGKDFHTNTQMKVEQNDTDFLTGRLGFLLGHKISESAQNPNNRYVQIALRGGLMREFLGNNIIHVNDKRYSGDIDGTSIYYGIDFDWNFADNQRLYFQVERSHSSDYTMELQARLGYRYQF